MTRTIFKAAMFVGLFSFVCCYGQVPEGTPEMKGVISIAGHTGIMPQFRILFGRGKETMSNSEGFFTFPIEDSDMTDYTLVICKRIKQSFDKKNTLKEVSVVPDKEYRIYSFQKSVGGGAWYQDDRRLHRSNFVLPPHSIVLLVDPKSIQEVKPWDITLPDNVIKLPKIVLKSSSEEHDLKRCAAKSLLYSLDATTYHESVRETIKKPEKGSKICISRVQ